MLEMGERGGGVGRRRRLPAPGKGRLGVRRKRRNDPAVILPPRQDLLGDVGANLGAAADEAGRTITKIGCKGLVIGRAADGLRATSTSWAACAAAASVDPHNPGRSRTRYGSKSRSMALIASNIAMCIIE